jgi:hypothetical protein
MTGIPLLYRPADRSTRVRVNPPTYAVVVTQFITHRPKRHVLVALCPAHGEERAFEVCDRHFSTDRPRCFRRSTGRSGPRRPPTIVGECHQNCAGEPTGRGSLRGAQARGTAGGSGLHSPHPESPQGCTLSGSPVTHNPSTSWRPHQHRSFESVMPLAPKDRPRAAIAVVIISLETLPRMQCCGLRGGRRAAGRHLPQEDGYSFRLWEWGCPRLLSVDGSGAPGAVVGTGVTRTICSGCGTSRGRCDVTTRWTECCSGPNRGCAVYSFVVTGLLVAGIGVSLLVLGDAA